MEYIYLLLLCLCVGCGRVVCVGLVVVGLEESCGHIYPISYSYLIYLYHTQVVGECKGQLRYTNPLSLPLIFSLVLVASLCNIWACTNPNNPDNCRLVQSSITELQTAQAILRSPTPAASLPSSSSPALNDEGSGSSSSSNSDPSLKRRLERLERECKVLRDRQKSNKIQEEDDKNLKLLLNEEEKKKVLQQQRERTRLRRLEETLKTEVDGLGGRVIDLKTAMDKEIKISKDKIENLNKLYDATQADLKDWRGQLLSPNNPNSPSSNISSRLFR